MIPKLKRLVDWFFEYGIFSPSRVEVPIPQLDLIIIDAAGVFTLSSNLFSLQPLERVDSAYALVEKESCGSCKSRENVIQ